MVSTPSLPIGSLTTFDFSPGQELIGWTRHPQLHAHRGFMPFHRRHQDQRVPISTLRRPIYSLAEISLSGRVWKRLASHPLHVREAGDNLHSDVSPRAHRPGGSLPHVLVLKQTPGTTDDHTHTHTTRWLTEFHAVLLAQRMTDCAKGSGHGPAAMDIQTRDVLRQAHKHNTTGTSSSAKVRDTNLSSWRLSRAIDTQFGIHRSQVGLHL